MRNTLRLAITADLHLGVRESGDAATHQLVDFLKKNPPELLILAGDIGAGKDFAPCLALFTDLTCAKALVPGNHDIWVEDSDPRGNSLQLYEGHLPELSAAHEFHYLDHGPLLFPDAGLGIVGSINWYDYSWTVSALKELLPDWEEHLRSKRFTRGRHNDARFVRWPCDDRSFTERVVAKLKEDIDRALTQVEKVIVVTHHPAFQALTFPRPASPPTIDGLLWDAFSGNRALEALLRRFAARIPYAFSGHTHRQREGDLDSIHGFNIGGDYHFKRLLVLDWPSGTVASHTFGDPEGGRQ